MARTEYIDVPDELRDSFNKSLEQRDRFILGVVQSHRREPSKAQKRLLRRTAVINSPMEGRGSLFRYLAPIWRSLTPEQKEVWREAGAISSITNWQLFISDNAARIRNSLTFPVPPSLLWQVRAGRLFIDSPSNEIILKQEHPLDYWVLEKVPGQSWKKQLVLLREVFSLPIEISIRYKSSLTPVGDVQSARYFVRVWTSYQGEDIFTDFNIDFNPVSDWVFSSISTSGLFGIVIGYTLFLEIIGYQGELLFDNIRAVHSGTNWARDPRCDAIDQKFLKAFAVVPPFWVPVSLPTGSSFASYYPPALS